MLAATTIHAWQSALRKRGVEGHAGVSGTALDLPDLDSCQEPVPNLAASLVLI